MVERSDVAPDIVIVGAARSGTSFLGATLARHPRIDGGKEKEPNYFSSRWDEGPTWYENQFEPRARQLLRLDASVSYTYPQHPRALERIREVAPKVQVIYTVREPVARLVSHFHLFRHYYDRRDIWPNLETAIKTSQMFLESGNYGHWLARLQELFPLEQLAVVPFPVLVDDMGAVLDLVLNRLGLDPAAQPAAAPAFRNEARQFRSPVVQAVHRSLHSGRMYPALRAAVGAERLRRMRHTVTKRVVLPTAQEEITTLSSEQRERVAAHATAGREAVTAWLTGQDLRLGVDWSTPWRHHAGAKPRNAE